MKQRLIANTTTVLQHLPVEPNLARQKSVSPFVTGLLKSRNVQFGEVTQPLNEAPTLASHETRIQDFFRATDLHYFVLAQLVRSRPRASWAWAGSKPRMGIRPLPGQ